MFEKSLHPVALVVAIVLLQTAFCGYLGAAELERIRSQ
jgi:hypothetical protein